MYLTDNSSARIFLILTGILILNVQLSRGQQYPTLVHPKDSSILTMEELRFSWDPLPDASWYEVQIDTNNSFSNPVWEQSNLTDYQIAWSPDTTNTYFWRVRYYDGATLSAWSDTGYFKIFSPKNIDTLRFWYLPDSGIVHSNDTLIKWKDLSGNSADLTPLAPSRAPKWEPSNDTIHQYRSVSFDGIDDKLETQPFSDTIYQGNSTFIMGRFKGPFDNYMKLMDGISNNGQQAFQCPANSSKIAIYGNNSLELSNTNVTSFNFFSLEFNGGNSKLIQNAKDSAVGNAGGNYLNGITLGDYYKLNTNTFRGEITEVIGYDTLLSDPARRLVEKYLRHKYAPPVNLGPNVHACDTTAQLSVNHYFEDITWSTGDSTDTITVDSAATYWVETTGIFGYTSSDTIQVQKINPPIPDLQKPADTSICLGDTLTWDPMIDDTGRYDLNWSTGSNDSILHVDSSGGYHLTVSDTFGCRSASDTLDVFVSPFPDSASLGPDTSLCAGNTIQVTQGAGAADSYQWSTGENTPMKTIDTTGTYWVDLTDTIGCQASDTIDVTVIGDAPDPSFSFGATCDQNPVIFSDSSIAPTGDNIVSWTWAFGDGDSSNVQDPSHSYPDTGTYNVSLQVTLNTGCQEDTTVPITVHPLPQPNFTYTQACEEDPIEFQDSTVTQAGIQDHFWDFGDPSSSADTAHGDTVPYTYPNDGFRAVQLKVTDSNECMDSITSSVQVLPSPDADFQAEDVCKGDSVRFVDLSTGNVADRYWDLGNGNANSGDSLFKQLYFQSTYYYPTLEVTAPNGCQDDTIQSVQIHPKPDVEFEHDPLCKGTPVTFYDSSSIDDGDSLASFEWVLNGSDTFSGPQWTYTFQNEGPVTIIHRARSYFGCEASELKNATVNEVPNVDLELDPSYGEAPLTVDLTPQGNFDSAQWSFGDGSYDSSLTPTHTYTDSGVHRVRLTGINSYGCRDSAFDKVFALIPRIDVRIPYLRVEEQNGYYEVKAKIENLGPITLSELDLELKAQNAPAIRETWSGDLPVGTWTEHTFKGRIEKGDGIPRICVTGTDPNGLEDHIPWNNEACWTPKGGLRILNIYPNPSSKFLYVEMRLPSDQDLSYRIYDPRGRIVLDRRIEDAQKGFLRIRPPLGKLEDGTYTIRIEGANDQVQEQFIKGER